ISAQFLGDILLQINRHIPAESFASAFPWSAKCLRSFVSPLLVDKLDRFHPFHHFFRNSFFVCLTCFLFVISAIYLINDINPTLSSFILYVATESMKTVPFKICIIKRLIIIFFFFKLSVIA